MSTFTFGKYKGRSYSDIARTDASYFQWALDNVTGFRAKVGGVKVSDKRTIPIKSSCGTGEVKNAGLAKPGQKEFVSKSSPYYRSKEAPNGAFDPKRFPTQERMDYHMSQLNPVHRAIEALEDHLDMVFMKHHGDQFEEFPDDEPPW